MHRPPAFELDRRRSAFLNQPSRVPDRVLDDPIWNVRNGMSAMTSARRAPRDNGARVMHHLVERHRNRALVPEHHHAERIADEQRIDAGSIEQTRHRGVIRGEHGDLLAALFLLAESPER